jgi:hypothetical protein
MVPVRPQRLPTIALNRAEDTAKILFVYKRASAPFPGEMVCPVYEQACETTCVYNWQRRFSPLAALDSFPRGAQNHSYTND